MKLLPSIVIGVVTVSVIASFFIIGSPMTERVRRFDERRVNDLQSVQWEIINYWQKKNRLPATLDVLRDDIRGFVPPQDPETGTPYEYAVKDATSFSLCATFSLVSDASINTRGMTKPVPVGRITKEHQSWEHDSGRVCFSRTIDKDLYPPTSPVPLKPMSVID